MPDPDQIRFLILIVPVVFMIIGIARPIFAVAGYMFIVYCKTSFYFPAIAQMHGELLFAVLILLRLTFNATPLRKLSMHFDPINKYLYYLILCVGVSLVVALDRQFSWDIAVYHFIKTLILYVMIVFAIDTKTDLKFFVYSLLGMFVYLAYEPIYGFLTGTGGSVQMYGTNYQSDVGILAGHVALANNMNQMIPFAWFFFMSAKNNIGRLFFGVALGVFLIALIGSGSRGGIVGLIVVGLCVIYFSKQRLKAAVIVGLIVLVLGGSIVASAIHTASRVDASSTERRLTGLAHGFGMVQKGNLLGVGPGCYLLARARYFGYRMEAHNIYGQILGDLGLPGMLVTFLLVRQFFRNINSVKQRLSAIKKEKDFLFYLLMAVQVSLITRLVVSMASHGLYYFYWYVMAALIVSTRHIVDQEESNTDSV